MGVLTCLPSFWRGCQCVRRYANDKKRSSPQYAYLHLFNLAKYLCGIGHYMTLAMWRINRKTPFQAPFLTFALLHSFYTSIWDVVMDWNLGKPYAKRILLRKELTFRHAWIYYAASLLNVVLRFNWIFYAIFSTNIQHSAFLTFFISLSEVFRRGIWSVLRVEKEHCANMMRLHGSHEPTLPYKSDLTCRYREDSGAAEARLQDRYNPSPVVAAIDVEVGVGRRRASSMLACCSSSHPSGSHGDLGFKAAPQTEELERHQLPSHLYNATAAQFSHSSEAEETEDDGGHSNSEGAGTPLEQRIETQPPSGNVRMPKKVDS